MWRRSSHGRQLDGLVSGLDRTSQAHGHLQCLWVLHLDIEAERLQQAHREELDLLRLGEGASQPAPSRQQLQEAFLVLRHAASLAARRELAEWIGSERRHLAHIEELGEMAPSQHVPLPILDVHVPEVCRVVEVVSSHPRLLLFRNLLSAKIRFTIVDEGEWIALAVKLGETPLLVAR